jgi:hypothetical protein
MIKAAVILAGMPRTYESCYPSLFKMLKGLRADIYIHAWNIQGNLQVSRKGDKVVKDFIRTVQVSENDLYRVYKPKKIVMEDYNGFEKVHAGLAAVYESYSDRVYIPVLSQWYKVQKGYELIESPDDYDLILRCRFDSRYHTGVDWKKILYYASQGIIFPNAGRYRHNLLGNMIDDTFAAGSHKNMKIYCNLYAALYNKEYMPIIPNIVMHSFGSEATMTLHLKQKKVHCLASDISYTIIRDEKTLETPQKKETEEFFANNSHLAFSSKLVADPDIYISSNNKGKIAYFKSLFRRCVKRINCPPPIR